MHQSMIWCIIRVVTAQVASYTVRMALRAGKVLSAPSPAVRTDIECLWKVSIHKHLKSHGDQEAVDGDNLKEKTESTVNIQLVDSTWRERKWPDVLPERGIVKSQAGYMFQRRGRGGKNKEECLLFLPLRCSLITFFSNIYYLWR